MNKVWSQTRYKWDKGIFVSYKISKCHWHFEKKLGNNEGFQMVSILRISEL